MPWLILLLCLVLVSCSKSPATFTPAPRAAGQSSAAIHAEAQAWVARDPANRYYAPVAPTGSMQPVINENALLLLARYRGQPIANGAVIDYHYSPQYPRMLHVVADQTPDSVYVSGYNNRVSDGWQKKSAITGYVVGQLYLP